MALSGLQTTGLIERQGRLLILKDEVRGFLARPTPKLSRSLGKRYEDLYDHLDDGDDLAVHFLVEAAHHYHQGPDARGMARVLAPAISDLARKGLDGSTAPSGGLRGALRAHRLLPARAQPALLHSAKSRRGRLRQAHS